MEFVQVLKVINKMLEQEKDNFLKRPTEYTSIRIETLINVRNELMQSKGFQDLKNRLE